MTIPALLECRRCNEYQGRPVSLPLFFRAFSLAVIGGLSLGLVLIGTETDSKTLFFAIKVKISAGWSNTPSVWMVSNRGSLVLQDSGSISYWQIVDASDSFCKNGTSAINGIKEETTDNHIFDINIP